MQTNLKNEAINKRVDVHVPCIKIETKTSKNGFPNDFQSATNQKNNPTGKSCHTLFCRILSGPPFLFHFQITNVETAYYARTSLTNMFHMLPLPTGIPYYTKLRRHNVKVVENLGTQKELSRIFWIHFLWYTKLRRLAGHLDLRLGKLRRIFQNHLKFVYP